MTLRLTLVRSLAAHDVRDAVHRLGDGGDGERSVLATAARIEDVTCPQAIIEAEEMQGAGDRIGRASCMS